MRFGRQLGAWRHHRELSQARLAQGAGVTQAYLARLESGQADPSLSILQKLAAALGVSVGTLVDQNPPLKPLSREDLDRLARAVFHPGRGENKNLPHLRALSRVFRDRRAALGLYRPRKGVAAKASRTSRGDFALRRVRSLLGEETWQALLRRIDKHAAFEAGPIL